MQSSNSMDTIGRDAPLKSVRIALLDLVDSGDVEVSEHVVDSEVDLEDVETLVAEVDLAAAMEVAGEALEAATVVEGNLVLMVAQEQLRQHQIHSPTMLHLAPREARSSTFVT
jgi:hypothetical protein